MFLRLLKYGYNSHYLRQGKGLWLREKIWEKFGTTKYGLRFKNTLPQYRFAWITEGLIDWDKFAFFFTITEIISFNTINYYNMYKKRWYNVKDIMNDI